MKITRRQFGAGALLLAADAALGAAKLAAAHIKDAEFIEEKRKTASLAELFGIDKAFMHIAVTIRWSPTRTQTHLPISIT